ncbi:MAG: 3-methyl-2-oxobutanoate hydroxymethyltransferase [Coriobacteriia bacterium]|nr:3-methyl-2-oxobutanoate hydroxymethyltransferase [Coriobacteriia bacterium]
MSATQPKEPERRPVTTTALRAMKDARQPIVMITAYDTPTARLVDEAGVDVILVGDSVGMVVLGLDSTLPVTMDDMLRHVSAVVRGTKRALVVADMPFLSFQITAEDALRNAGRFLAEAGASAVKVEGGRRVAPVVQRIVEAGIPVMGHVGLTPQSVHQFGGYKVQAKETPAALELLEDARALQDAGAFAVVLECIPAELASIVSEEIEIPTIGIGAGLGCDGQVQVLHDVLGLADFTPKHAKRYADVGAAIRDGVQAYARDVRGGDFPAEEHGTRMEPDAAAEVEKLRSRGLRAVAGGVQDEEA